MLYTDIVYVHSDRTVHVCTVYSMFSVAVTHYLATVTTGSIYVCRVELQIKSWEENFDEGCIFQEASHKEKSLIDEVSMTRPPVGVGSKFARMHGICCWSVVMTPVTSSSHVFTHTHVGIIHGDMTISNVIFDDEVRTN